MPTKFSRVKKPNICLKHFQHPWIVKNAVIDGVIQEFNWTKLTKLINWSKLTEDNMFELSWTFKCDFEKYKIINRWREQRARRGKRKKERKKIVTIIITRKGNIESNNIYVFESSLACFDDDVKYFEKQYFI